VVCSACGYENQTGHRFCGMCGMPLPHSPLTAPGANSTLDLTRVPFEKHSGSLSTSGRTGILSEASHSRDSQVTMNPDGDTSTQATVAEDSRADEVPAAEQAAISDSATPPKELVPDLPLDEYVKTFHYEPPTDPSEITMRGDARVQDVETPAGATTSAEVSTATPEAVAPVIAASDDALSRAPDIGAPSTIAASTSTTRPKAILETTTAASEDVDSRLGLEPEAPAEARIERPRFLDINPPPAEAKPAATSGTSTIVGPSFLGLSGPPEFAEPSQPEVEAEESPSGHGRLWLATAVVLIFVALGAMEWRAQRNQTGNGPVEVIRTKMRGLTHPNPSPADSNNAGASGTSDNGAKPDMQVQEQSKPNTQNQAATGSTASSTNAMPAPQSNGSAGASSTGPKTPAGSQPPTVQKALGPPEQSFEPRGTQAGSGGNAAANQAPAIAPKATPSQQKAPDAIAQKPKPAAAATENQEVTVKQITPGADEMAKAKNASDSAATAAWLWKATAKGNPDAPVQLADLYVKGDGVPRSCEQAVVLLKTAAEKENARACNRLAAMYATGNCVNRNRVEAYRWVSSALAANPSSQWAQQNRDLLWQQMTPEERAAAAKYR
jgi:hypothetical protein